MGTSFASANPRCPLCGSVMISVSKAGRVLSGDLHPIALNHTRGRGYTLCEECGTLADLPFGQTFN
jgi:hypothetical protein